MGRMNLSARRICWRFELDDIGICFECAELGEGGGERGIKSEEIIH